MYGVLTALALLALGAESSPASPQDRLDLGGQWRLTRHGASESLTAHVPGNVHLDLIRQRVIPDPFYRDNAAQMEWVYEATWNYERTVHVPAELLKRDVVLLRCEGLDTVARIEVNGRLVGEADNMYRTWEFDVKPWLRAGDNDIRITFSPVKSYIEAFLERAPKVPNATGIDIANIRKAPYSNSWDFCPKFLPCGIYKPISLVAFDTARISDVQIRQDLTDRATAQLEVKVAAEQIGSPVLTAEAVVMFQGKVLDRQETQRHEHRH